MRIEIIKTKNGFRIPQLEEIGVSSGRFYAELDLLQVIRPTDETCQKTKTIAAMEATLQRLGKNDLLMLKLKHLQKNFTFSETDSDENVLQQVLVEKYAD